MSQCQHEGTGHNGVHSIESLRVQSSQPGGMSQSQQRWIAQKGVTHIPVNDGPIKADAASGPLGDMAPNQPKIKRSAIEIQQMMDNAIGICIFNAHLHGFNLFTGNAMETSGSVVLSSGELSQFQHEGTGQIRVHSMERLCLQNSQSSGMSQGQKRWIGQKGITLFPVNDGLIEADAASGPLGDMAPPQPNIKRSAVEIQQRRENAIKRCRVMAYLSPMQKEAMKCLNEHNGHAFILTPTASGKTTLIHACNTSSKTSVVFAPYRILVQQLHLVLAKEGITYSWPFGDTDSSIFQMLSTAEYIVMPYEAATLSLGLLHSLHEMGRLDRIFIDEVTLSALVGILRIES